MKKKKNDGHNTKSKLPADARLAYKGVIWSVYQWDQELFDGTHATFEGLRRNDGVKIIATMDGKLVITKETIPSHKDHFYTLPGGGMEEGETPIETARRELLEEAGLKSENWEELETIDVFQYLSVDFYIHLFLARDCVKVAKPKLDAGEKITIEKVEFEEFIEKLGSTKDKFGTSVLNMLSDQQKMRNLKSKIGLK